jgi:8-oxo-dGTP diphosphatase
MQRVAAYALVVRDDAVLLTRNSPRGPHPGLWNLPGGGIEHGEAPADAVVREVAEETGLACTVGDIVIVDNTTLRGTAPSGRDEKLHSVGIVYDATVPPDAEPRVVEVDGTTDLAAWVRLADVESGATPVYDTVHAALAARLPQ